MDDTQSKIETQHNLRDHFLIAMPQLEGSYFSHTVTYICDHNEHGAMGIVINQTMDIDMLEVFKQLKITGDNYTQETPILLGGPVNKHQGLVLHRNQGNWTSTLKVTPSVSITASKDIISAIANNDAPSGAQLVLGYAGWSAGQLEDEIADNAWLTTKADERILFDVPVEQRWSEVSKTIGIDLNLLTSSAGRA